MYGIQNCHPTGYVFVFPRLRLDLGDDFGVLRYGARVTGVVPAHAFGQDFPGGVLARLWASLEVLFDQFLHLLPAGQQFLDPRIDVQKHLTGWPVISSPHSESSAHTPFYSPKALTTLTFLFYVI